MNSLAWLVQLMRTVRLSAVLILPIQKLEKSSLITIHDLDSENVLEIDRD